ncbi:unnamed protein product [Menidia menidia]|uniref:(Atlantic silverside) hypothetical protein n=1 Tax=Menidia menidia TaxID=238744 RepID=A0A8S4ARG0_9TELE|nr:unnamed protein product [Menidia menidia]
MRSCWILSTLTILVTLGLVLVILGQYHEMLTIDRKTESLKVFKGRFDTRLLYEDRFKDSIEKLLSEGQSMTKTLETALETLGQEVEKKKTEQDACQAEMKTKKEEVESSEASNKQTTDALKAESDAWQQETNTLKAQLTQVSPICEYVKKKDEATKLCATNATST